jgi:hypothetical protein
MEKHRLLQKKKQLYFKKKKYPRLFSKKSFRASQYKIS